MNLTKLPEHAPPNESGIKDTEKFTFIKCLPHASHLLSIFIHYVVIFSQL